jgi:hypothetical protein
MGGGGRPSSIRPGIEEERRPLTAAADGGCLSPRGEALNTSPPGRGRRRLRRRVMGAPLLLDLPPTEMRVTVSATSDRRRNRACALAHPRFRGIRGKLALPHGVGCGERQVRVGGGSGGVNSAPLEWHEDIQRRSFIFAAAQASHDSDRRPYRSGTGDDPGRMAENVRFMESHALPLFRAGHVPVVGEWLALPLVALAGISSCRRRRLQRGVSSHRGTIARKV